MAAWWRRRNGSSSNPEEEWQRISTEVKASRDARLAALQGEEALVQDLTATLFRLDPIGLNFETNTDEYEAEAQTIALRLPSVSNLDEVREMVHEEFVRWFGADVAGNPAKYVTAAQAVLAAWHRHHPLDVPSAIRLMADYDCWPTWDDETSRNIDPTSLPITRRLAEQLAAWAARYDASLDRSDPPSSRLPDPQHFVADGRLLAELLARELAGIASVQYREPT